MKRIKFILPDWDDIVDPGFNRFTEEHSEEYMKDKFMYGHRLWHVFPVNETLIDGVLVSRPLLNPVKTDGTISESMKYKRIIKMKENGCERPIRCFLRIPEHFEVIGDCGAWQYINFDNPPYDIGDTLEFYRTIGVDYGVTLDHIAIGPDGTKRVELTIRNAVKSFSMWKEGYETGTYKYILMGSVQGINQEDYINSFKRLYEAGFRHFALGGLAKRNTEFILKLLRKLDKLTTEYGNVERIHFLGVARPKVIKALTEMFDSVREISMDNATFLRMAWTRSRGNYILGDKLYTAIRVRIGSPGDREILDILHRYERRELGLEEVVKHLRNYLRGTPDITYLPDYIATLRDRPWEKCGCRICREFGIDVLIFRRNDRNRRRGFHNVWQFMRALTTKRFPSIIVTDESPLSKVSREDECAFLSGLLSHKPRRVAIITYCTQEKTVPMERVEEILRKSGLRIPGFDLDKESVYRKTLSQFVRPAKEMYSGGFRPVLKLAKTLQGLGIAVDVFIISARYGLIDWDTEIVPYEATLKRLSKEDLIRWERERKVSKLMRERILNSDYDLVIVNLTKHYLTPVEEVVKELGERKKAIYVVPSSLDGVPRESILIADNIKKRMNILRRIRECMEHQWTPKITEFIRGRGPREGNGPSTQRISDQGG